MAVVDLNAQGRYYGMKFDLEARTAEDAAGVRKALQGLQRAGVRYVVADLSDALMRVASEGVDASMLLFNVAATGDDLRNEHCAARVFHVIPSRAMLADALAQYLVKRNWRRWLIVTGPLERDREFLQALQRAGQRYGAQIADTRTWESNADIRRSAQAEFPLFTAKADYDVVVVSDETAQFGQFLAYHTYLPRPLAGTQSLVPTAWFWAHEQWGATQLNHRFMRATKRKMTSSDWAAWIATTAVGEALMRGKAGDPSAVAAYLVRDDTSLEGYKGVSINFRPWDRQLRQPVLLVTPEATVSASPQDGYLHPKNVLDTLGYDEPESRCRSR
jgi:ABC transporter substrate binding protein (PQQ-dependent alcohol dehydrogenase system)